MRGRGRFTGAAATGVFICGAQRVSTTAKCFAERKRARVASLVAYAVGGVHPERTVDSRLDITRPATIGTAKVPSATRCG